MGALGLVALSFGYTVDRGAVVLTPPTLEFPGERDPCTSGIACARAQVQMNLSRLALSWSPAAT